MLDRALQRTPGRRYGDAAEFIAAASGVLTDAQFKQFRKRDRNALERTQNEVWQTGVYIDNLLKIAGRL